MIRPAIRLKPSIQSRDVRKDSSMTHKLCLHCNPYRTGVLLPLSIYIISIQWKMVKRTCSDHSQCACELTSNPTTFDRVPLCHRRTVRFSCSFVNRASPLSNSLSPNVLPPNYNLTSFNINIDRFLSNVTYFTFN